jgi:2,3-bisphosphoglycerate-independent phosphoglycerate mutase
MLATAPARVVEPRRIFAAAAGLGRRGRGPGAPRYDRPVDLRPLLVDNGSRIVLVVVDGLGGMADERHGTELEEASTPNLDRLAAEGVTGLLEPVGPGITPGSGPGHLALFGYDPLAHQLGRGALSAAGLEFPLRPGDVAARGNLCTLDAEGRVVDRRAGRLADEEARRVVERLQDEVRVPGAEVFFRHEREHRVLVVVRGEGLDPRVSDTDPQAVGVPPLPPRALAPQAERTARVVTALLEGARRVLAGEPRANGLLLRGFDAHRELPAFPDRYGLRAAALAVYPMYRGVARLLGMEVLGAPQDLGEEVELLGKHWEEADFFFLHHKDADSAGEDGDRARKVAAIERLDAALPDVLALGPDVLAVTGDHATPSQLASHSWHPVPVVVWGRRCGRDDVDRFGERWCLHGGLGRRPSTDLMPLLLATAGRLAKFGA